MRPFIAYVFSLFCSLYIYAQQKPVLIFDLEKGTVDSLALVHFDSTIVTEKTSHNIGLYNNEIQLMPLTPATQNTFPNSQFAKKRRAEDHYDLSRFPVRTAVRLLNYKDGKWGSNCSGILVSERHVLTATHCLVRCKNDSLLIRKMKACPVFNNGLENAEFGCHPVSKITCFKDWCNSGEDLALLTLKNPIGIETGWVSFGFTQDFQQIKNKVFHKFSYPAVPFPQADPTQYNGDTLYHSYGVLDGISTIFYQFQNTHGIRGESGSSIIRIDNANEYTTYGVLSFSADLSHTPIRNWQFYTFKQQIEKDILSSPAFPNNWEDVFLYPNPTSNHITIQSRLSSIQNIQIYDNLGRLIQEQKMNTIKERLVLQHLPSGLYHIKIVTSKDTFLRKFIKTK